MTVYKKSQFNLEVIDSGLIIFNSFSGSMVHFPPSETENWNRSVFDSDTEKELVRLKILVPDDLDEYRMVFNEVGYNQKNPNRSFFRIMTTTHCNAKCPYCFEKDFKRSSMNIKTAEDVVRFIVEKSANVSEIGLGWFGGEPLLNPDIINYIYSEVVKTVPDKTVFSTIVTNGSLIDDKMVENFLKWNIKKIQITLDGLQKTHDAIKQYSDSTIGFYSTLQNVQRLIDNGFKPSIRINYGSDNYSEVVELIEYLHNRFNNLVNVYCSPLFVMGNSSVLEVDPTVEREIMNCLQRCRYFDPIRILKRRQIGCGLASYDTHMNIDPDGNVYKCCEAMVRPDLSLLGDVRCGILNKEIMELWKKPSQNGECVNCAYLPICLEGCKCTKFGISSSKCFRYKNQVPRIISDYYHKLIDIR